MSVLIRENRDNYWMLNWLDKFMEGHKGFICGGCFKNIFNQEKATVYTIALGIMQQLKK